MIDDNVNLDEEQVESNEEPDTQAIDEETETVETPEVEEPQESQENEEVKQLKEDLVRSLAQVNEYKDRMLRIQADFENFKKRSKREKDDIAQYTREEVIKKLLPVLDNFDLAIENSSTDNLEAYRRGVELVAKQLKDVLEAEGLKEIEAQGEAFDPNFHHGVAVDDNPEIEDQHITEVYQKGYELKGKVLRPSMVKVNQK